MRTKFFNLSFAATSLCLLGAGCINPETEPQKRAPQQNGTQVVVKDIFSIDQSENKALGPAKFVELFSSLKGSVNTGYSMTLVTLAPGKGLALHSLKSTETIYVVSGGGMLKVDGEAIILRQGKAVYIPPDAKQSTLNNGQTELKFITIISPPYENSFETVLGAPPKMAGKAKPQIKTVKGTMLENGDIPKELKFSDELPQLKKDVVPNKAGELNYDNVPASEMKKMGLQSDNPPENPVQQLQTEEKQLIIKAPQSINNVNINNLETLTPPEEKAPIIPTN